MKIKSIVNWLRSAIADPFEELTRWERVVRYIWQVIRQGARQLSQDRASMMAASLTYRTLFGLLPVTVVGAGVAKAIMGVERFQEFLDDSIRALGLNEVQLEISESGTVVTLGSWLSEIVSSGMNVSIAALTWVGLLVLVYSAIALLVDIETCFNVICRAKRGRTWLRRLPLYWFVLTFGPILLALAFWLNSQIDSMISSFVLWDSLQWGLESIFDFLLTWFAVLFLYKMVPTMKMNLKPSLVGALLATILLLVGKGTLGLYVDNALSLRHMYGSLGLVPVFMFWLYLMWLFILLGLQVAAILQQVSYSEPELQGR
ncbi:MAG: YihY/virulence factor BrkB family protein [Phycisphaerales bacterium]|nr:YihY/virulence factor BrkB family protein [Planctomycetota bacterium]MBL6997751.1 YihY/virulence factor BrkB family protein [Phycisphaerales bacterium]